MKVIDREIFIIYKIEIVKEVQDTIYVVDLHLKGTN